MHKIKTRPLIINLRHASIGKDTKNRDTKFQNEICINNGDILVQENNMKNQNFAFFTPHLSEEIFS